LEKEWSRGFALLLEEAAALSLLGRHDEALDLIADGAADSAQGPTPRALPLLHARILIARGAAGDLAAARRILERLADSDGRDWRTELGLSRLHAREGRRVDAATLLKSALDHFRAQDEEGRTSGAAALARMLVHEADLLQDSRRAPQPAADAAVLDQAALLRLIETGKRLAAETDPAQVLRVVLHEAIELSGLDRGFVVLVTGTELDIALGENLDWSEIERPSFEVSRTLVRKAVAVSKPIFLRLAEGAADPALAESLSEIGVRSVACVPVVYGEATLGVLYLDGRDPAHSFSAAKERLIELFASQAAVALDNARAHRAKSDALEAAEETIRRQRSGAARERYFTLIGGSDAMQEVYERLERIRGTEAPVLILGETGTGKELAARLIHSEGPRAGREFVAANCAGMAETLLETELFGHERGAFTGADRPSPGLFEAAHNGTLFLDEVGDMSPRMQGDLLRALQSGEVRRVGGRDTKRVDVRVIAATHRDLAAMVQCSEFRQDLYFRLDVLGLKLPALRERAGDVPLLLQEILTRLAPESPLPQVSERALRRLSAYPWPGNVRELENVARQLLLLGVETIDEQHLPPHIRKVPPRIGASGSLQRVEEEAIRRAVAATGGRRAAAARMLGIDRKTLYLKLKRLGLES